jgi:hypothetical protein
MSLSDRILARPHQMAHIRSVLSRLASELEAGSAFLIDEAGVPFAAVGHIEFRFPHPLPGLDGDASGEAILEKLLGIHQKDDASPFLLSQVCKLALLVVVLEVPLASRKRRHALSRVKKTARELKTLLDEPQSD